MQQDKTLLLLGLAKKAGKLVSGGALVEKVVKEGKACLVIVAEDASSNTKKKLQNMCAYYHVPIYFYSDRDKLGHCIGKEYRSSIALTDKGFGNTIGNQLKAEA